MAQSLSPRYNRKRMGRPLLFAAAALLSLLPPSTSAAHGDAVPFIAFWGPFSAAEADCQQGIGVARNQCLFATLGMEQDCALRTVMGNECDPAAATVRERVRIRTDELIDANCGEEEARSLYFRDLAEIRTDKNFVCTRVPEALLQLTLAPLPRAHTSSEIECVRRTMMAAGRYLRIVTRSQTRALDRLATHPLPPSAVNALINLRRRQVNRMRSLAGAKLEQRCPTLATLYGISATDLLLQVELQANCAVGAGYVQSAYTCPRGYLPTAP